MRGGVGSAAWQAASVASAELDVHMHAGSHRVGRLRYVDPLAVPKPPPPTPPPPTHPPPTPPPTPPPIVQIELDNNDLNSIDDLRKLAAETDNMAAEVLEKDNTDDKSTIDNNSTKNILRGIHFQYKKPQGQLFYLGNYDLLQNRLTYLTSLILIKEIRNFIK